MSMNIRFPNITAVTPAEQITQIKSYLHQLVQQLNWALSNLESTGSASESSEAPALSEITEETFNELKSLIAQSTAMLDTYYEQINNKLEGQYVLQSTFYRYTQSTDQRLEQLVSQESFDAYKQEVAEDMAGLDGKYVSQADFDGYKQEVSNTFAGLDLKYVPAATFVTYQQENTQTITALQEAIAELTQRVDDMQETGGEEHG